MNQLSEVSIILITIIIVFLIELSQGLELLQKGPNLTQDALLPPFVVLEVHTGVNSKDPIELFEPLLVLVVKKGQVA